MSRCFWEVHERCTCGTVGEGHKQNALCCRESQPETAISIKVFHSFAWRANSFITEKRAGPPPPVRCHWKVDFTIMPAQGQCPKDLITFCACLLKESLSEGKCQKICTSPTCQVGGCRPFHLSYRNTPRLYIIRLWGYYYFTVSSPVRQRNMSDKPTAQKLTWVWLFPHRILHTHMHMYRNNYFSDSPSYRIKHTHTLSYTMGHDRELLTASTWSDRPFTISLCVKPNVLKEVSVFVFMTRWKRWIQREEGT